MAEQKAKKTTTRKPKEEKQTATFKGRTFDVIDVGEHAVCLTDGTIHFFARRKDVTLG